MARTRYGSDRGLSARMGGTLVGIGLLYVILAAVLFAIGVNAVFVLVISAALLGGQWWFSDSLAMSAMRAVVVTPEQAPQLHAIVDRICAMGTTVLLVEQKAFHALKIAKRAYVLENGRIVMSNTGAGLLADPQIKSAYLGI